MSSNSPYQIQRDPPKDHPAEWSEIAPTLQEALVTAIHVKKWPIYLFGEQGRGKTCAMAWLFTIWPNWPRWFDAIDFTRCVQERRSGDSGDRYFWESNVDDASLFLLDDVGIRLPSDSVFEVIYELSNRRGTKPTVYASNLTPEQLANVFDARVASRMLRGTVIEVTGEDRRMRNHRFVQA
ncbi:MAG: hypothetical protein KDA86_13510 [Planctomycetaceae bacterium]|nr:hypothetical protein [Planctomycetaceae bacterium]